MAVAAIEPLQPWNSVPTRNHVASTQRKNNSCNEMKNLRHCNVMSCLGLNLKTPAIHRALLSAKLNWCVLYHETSCRKSFTSFGVPMIPGCWRGFKIPSPIFGMMDWQMHILPPTSFMTAKAALSAEARHDRETTGFFVNVSGKLSKNAQQYGFPANSPADSEEVRQRAVLNPKQPASADWQDPTSNYNNAPRCERWQYQSWFDHDPASHPRKPCDGPRHSKGSLHKPCSSKWQKYTKGTSVSFSTNCTAINGHALTK